MIFLSVDSLRRMTLLNWKSFVSHVDAHWKLSNWSVGNLREFSVLFSSSYLKDHRDDPSMNRRDSSLISKIFDRHANRLIDERFSRQKNAISIGITVSQFKHFVVETSVPWKSSWIHVSSFVELPTAASPLITTRPFCTSLFDGDWLWFDPATLDLWRCFSYFSFSSFFSAKIDEYYRRWVIKRSFSPVKMSAQVLSKWLRNSWASCCISLSKVPDKTSELMKLFLVLFNLLFSFLNLLMNFFGWRAPVLRLADMIVWNKSARHVKRFSFLFFCVNR